MRQVATGFLLLYWSALMVIALALFLIPYFLVGLFVGFGDMPFTCRRKGKVIFPVRVEE